MTNTVWVILNTVCSIHLKVSKLQVLIFLERNCTFLAAFPKYSCTAVVTTYKRQVCCGQAPCTGSCHGRVKIMALCSCYDCSGGGALCFWSSLSIAFVCWCNADPDGHDWEAGRKA